MTDSARIHHNFNWLADIPEYHGLWSWVTSIDHKQIGIMYILSALFFFIAGLVLALIMRIQLMLPMNHFISQDTYNQIGNRQNVSDRPHQRCVSSLAVPGGLRGKSAG